MVEWSIQLEESQAENPISLLGVYVIMHEVHMLVFTLVQVKAGALTPIFRCDAVGGYSDRIWGPDERDELLRLATQVGGIGIFETDFERDRSRFSPELCAILGLPGGAEMTYAEAILLYHGPDRIRGDCPRRSSRPLPGERQVEQHASHQAPRRSGALDLIAGQAHISRHTHGPIPVRSIGTVVDITPHILKRRKRCRKTSGGCALLWTPHGWGPSRSISPGLRP